MDWLKEMFEAHNQRIKSPIVGSVTLAFIVWNWQPIFYVLFANNSARKRLEYWNTHTSDSDLFFIPAFLGVFIAIAIPFITFISAAIVRIPTNELRKLIQESAHELALKKVEQQQALEKKKEDLIASAVKQQEELSKLDGIKKSELEKRFENIQNEPVEKSRVVTEGKLAFLSIEELEVEAEYSNIFEHVIITESDTEEIGGNGFARNDMKLIELLDQLFSVDRNLDPYKIRAELFEASEYIKYIASRIITLDSDPTKEHVVRQLKKQAYLATKKLRELIAGLASMDNLLNTNNAK